MTSQTKSDRKAQLEQTIEDTHDMQQVGQAWSYEACGVQGKDTCTICGLTHHWRRNGQNSGDSDSYHDSRGNPLTLAEAARQICD